MKTEIVSVGKVISIWYQFAVSLILRVNIRKYFHSPYSQSSPLKPLRHLHSYWCSPRSIHVALCLHGFSFSHSLTTENQSILYCSKLRGFIFKIANIALRLHKQNIYQAGNWFGPDCRQILHVRTSQVLVEIFIWLDDSIVIFTTLNCLLTSTERRGIIEVGSRYMENFIFSTYWNSSINRKRGLDYDLVQTNWHYSRVIITACTNIYPLCILTIYKIKASKIKCTHVLLKLYFQLFIVQSEQVL